MPEGLMLICDAYRYSLWVKPMRRHKVGQFNKLYLKPMNSVVVLN